MKARYEDKTPLIEEESETVLTWPTVMLQHIIKHFSEEILDNLLIQVTTVCPVIWSFVLYHTKFSLTLALCLRGTVYRSKAKKLQKAGNKTKSTFDRISSNSGTFTTLLVSLSLA